MKTETFVKIAIIVKHVIDCLLIIACGLITHWGICLLLGMPAFTGHAYKQTIFFIITFFIFWTFAFIGDFKFIIKNATEKIENMKHEQEED